MADYGPNTAAVQALIARAKRLTRDECDRLVIHDGAIVLAAESAMRAAMRAIEETERIDAWTAAVDDARDAIPRGGIPPALTAARIAAHWAVTALVARDLITDEQFGALYGPWASVMGEEIPA